MSDCIRRGVFILTALSFTGSMLGMSEKRAYLCSSRNCITQRRLLCALAPTDKSKQVAVGAISV